MSYDGARLYKAPGCPMLAIGRVLYYIVLYLLPVLNPKSYDGARVLEASGRPFHRP